MLFVVLLSAQIRTPVSNCLFKLISNQTYRCLDISHFNEVERIQAIRLVRKMAHLKASNAARSHEPVVPLSLFAAIVSVSLGGAEERDRVYRTCLAVLCELGECDFNLYFWIYVLIWKCIEISLKSLLRVFGVFVTLQSVKGSVVFVNRLTWHSVDQLHTANILSQNTVCFFSDVVSTFKSTSLYV